MRICSKCKIEKDETDFTPCQRYWCKDCVRISRKANYNREKNTLKMREYRQTEAGKESIKKTSEKRREKTRLYAIKYRLEHPGAAKAYRARVAPYLRQKEKDRRKTDIEWKIKCNLRRRICHLVNREYKSAKTMELLGCSIEQFKQHIESKFKPGMTWENYGPFGWHIDHVLPCSSFDLTLEENQRKCFHYSNLQPLWWNENLSKGAKTVV